MICSLSSSDLGGILEVINTAAQSYQGVIPDDQWEEPYLAREELKGEIGNGVQFYGWVEDDKLLGVMGIQTFQDTALIRHAYVLPKHQREDIGGKLLEYLIDITENSTILADPWEDAGWAIAFYRKHGFQQVSSTETERLLRKYWDISEREIASSVVLKLEN